MLLNWWGRRHEVLLPCIILQFRLKLMYIESLVVNISSFDFDGLLTVVL